MKLSLYTILTMSAAVACTDGTWKSESEAKNISNTFIVQEYSIKDLSVWKLTVRETDSNWNFTYEVDENSIGGPLFVTVDKRSGKVIDHRGYQ